MADLDALQKRLRRQFTDPELLRQALVHRSYLNELTTASLRSNERLEYLGDAVLEFVVSDYLFRRFPEAPEGALTDLRSQVVRRDTLAMAGKQLGLAEHLYLGRGARTASERGQRQILADSYEAVIGALYLDQGLEAAQAFILETLGPLLDQLDAHHYGKDDKSRLQEIAQALYRTTPTYRLVQATGPQHDRDFLVEVRIQNRVAGRGTGKNKQAAEQAAAHEALKWLAQTDGAALAPTDLADKWPLAPSPTLTERDTESTPGVDATKHAP